MLKSLRFDLIRCMLMGLSGIYLFVEISNWIRLPFLVL